MRPPRVAKQGREEGTQPAFCLSFSQRAKLCYFCKSISPLSYRQLQSSLLIDGGASPRGGCLSRWGSGGGLLKLPQAQLDVRNSPCYLFKNKRKNEINKRKGKAKSHCRLLWCAGVEKASKHFFNFQLQLLIPHYRRKNGLVNSELHRPCAQAQLFW